MRRVAALLTVFAGIWISGCGGSGAKPGQVCSSDSDCASSDRCDNGICVLKNATSGGSGSTGTGTTSGTNGSSGSSGGIQVSWLSPDSGFVSGSVALAAQASPASEVASIALSVDSTSLTSANGTNAEATWDSTAVADGTHTLHAVATGTQGQSAQADRDVVVDNAAPVVAWLTPDSGALVGNSLSASIDAKDDGGSGIAQVQVELPDGGVLGSSAQAPFTVSADLTSVASGTIALDAVATDRAGNSSRATRTFLLDRPPAVSITSPDGGNVTGVFTAGAQVTDDLGIGSVTFQVDGNVVGQGVAGSSDSYTLGLNTDAFALGAHTLTAIATDTSAQTAQATEPFTVVDQAPVVTFDSPAEGSSVNGPSISVAVHATDDVNVAGVSYSVNGGTASQLGGSSGTIALNGCVLSSSITVSVTATDSRGQTTTATLHLTNTSPPPVLTALADQSSNDLAVKAQCGTPSGYTLYYSNQSGVTTAAQSHAVGSNGIYSDSPLTAGTRIYYAAAAQYGTAGQGPLSNEADAMPRAFCPTASWCVDDPPLGNFKINALYEASASDVYAVGAQSTVLHWDGTRWSRENFPVANVNLTGVAGNPNGVVVAVSMNDVFTRSAQGTWSVDDLGIHVFSNVVYDDGAAHLFEVGSWGRTYSSPDGTTWNLDFTESGGLTYYSYLAASSYWNPVTGVHRYVAGSDGTTVVYYYSSGGSTSSNRQTLPVRSMVPFNGQMWQIAGGNRFVDGVDAGPVDDRTYCVSPTGDFLAAYGERTFVNPIQRAVTGYGDQVYQIYPDGGPSLGGFMSGFGATVPTQMVALACGSGDVRVAFAGGAIGVVNASGYRQDSPGVGAEWRALGADAMPVAGGLDGMLAHFDDATGVWAADASRNSDYLHRATWYDLAANADGGFAVGDYWQKFTPQFGAPTWTKQGAAELSDGTWSGNLNPPFVLRSVVEIAGARYVGGVSGQFALYDGTSWSQLPSINGTGIGDIEALAATGASDIWAIYDNNGTRALAHYTSVGWAIPSGVPSGVPLALWAEPDGNQVWVSFGSQVSLWNGSSWTTLTSIPSDTQYRAIGGSSANDVWLAGSNKDLHFDGTSWTTIASPLVAPTRVASSPRWGVYMVDDNGGIWHRGR